MREKKENRKLLASGILLALFLLLIVLLQAILGFGISMIAALFVKDFFPAAGVLLPFGFGQGTGQALNYGGIYENQFGFVGGKTFGLTIAALRSKAQYGWMAPGAVTLLWWASKFFGVPRE